MASASAGPPDLNLAGLRISDADVDTDAPTPRFSSDTSASVPSVNSDTRLAARAAPPQSNCTSSSPSQPQPPHEEAVALVRLTSADSEGRLHRGAALRSPPGSIRRPSGATGASTGAGAGSMGARRQAARPLSLLGAPLGDYQSDDVLNAPAPVSPHSPHTPSPLSPLDGRGKGKGKGEGEMDVGRERRPTASSPMATSTTSSTAAAAAVDQATAVSVSPSSTSMTAPLPVPASARPQASTARVPRVRTPTVPRPAFAPHTADWTREAWAGRKVALVTGITGQDGSYLADCGCCVALGQGSKVPSASHDCGYTFAPLTGPVLLAKGYHVHGIIRRSSSFNTSRLHHLFGNERVERLALHYGDLTDTTALVHIISQVQ